MANQTEEAISSVLDLDSDLQQIFRNSWPEAWLQINLPLGSTRALLAIGSREARTPGKVAEVLGVSRTTVTGLLDRLESEGLLTRSMDPADRRSLVLSLTQKALDIIAQLEGNRRERLEQALRRLAPDDLLALRGGLEALTRQMRRE